MEDPIYFFALNTNHSILYDPPSCSLTAICRLHCCLVVQSVKEMLGRFCKPINSHENVEWGSVILCSYGIYWKEYNIIFSCTINLNIIYLLKNSFIWRGNQSNREGRVYEALFPKFNGVYKIFLLHTSCITQQYIFLPNEFGVYVWKISLLPMHEAWSGIWNAGELQIIVF